MRPLSFFGESELDQLPTGALGDLSGFLETTYVMRSSEAKLAEVPLAPLAFFGHPAPYSKDNFYNPLGADIPDWRRRMVEGGSRTEPNDEDTLRLLFGLRGDWFEGPLSGWSWEAHASYGESKRESHFGHIYDLERVANAVGPTIGDSPGDLRLRQRRRELRTLETRSGKTALRRRCSTTSPSRPTRRSAWTSGCSPSR